MPKRVLQGVIVSDKMDKTVTVSVERRIMHPKYKKFIRSTKKYAAHDETNQYKQGQVVEIEECRPLSKRKKWMVSRVIDVHGKSSEAGASKAAAKKKATSAEKAE